MDVIFICKILVEFFTVYINEQVVIVSDLQLIAKEYIK